MAGTTTISKEQILESIAHMSVMDLSDLVKAMEEKFGVSASAPMMAFGAMPGAASPQAEAAEEKTEFDVVMTDAGGNKVSVIKVVREATNLGLKEAKDLAEATPAKIKEGVSKEIAEELKKKLEEAGAKVELK